MYFLGEEAMESQEEDPVAAWHTGRSSSGDSPDCWNSRSSHHHWNTSLCWEKGKSASMTLRQGLVHSQYPTPN